MDQNTVTELEQASEIQKAYNKKIQYGYGVGIRWFFMSVVPCVFIASFLYGVTLWFFVIVLLPVIPIIFAVIDGSRLRKKAKQDQDLVITDHANSGIIIHDAKSSGFSKYNLAVLWVIAVVVSAAGIIGMFFGINLYISFKTALGFKDTHDIFDTLFLIFIGLWPIFLVIQVTIEKIQRKKLLDSQNSSTGPE